MERPKVNNISASGIIYKKSDPRQVFVETKDGGYPIKVFRNCVCLIGGNLIGEQSKSDRGPRDTFVREVGEELSFEKPLMSTEELGKLGVAAGDRSYRAAACKHEPTKTDIAALQELKSAISENAVHFADNIQYVPKRVLDSADPENKRGDVKGLNSCWTVPLDDRMWEILVGLQNSFGNLSNESISLVTSLEEIITNGIKCSWGYDQHLQRFFLEQGIAEAKNMELFPGPEVTWLGANLASYGHYFRAFTVAKHPFTIDLKKLVWQGEPDNEDERRAIRDFIGKDFPVARHGNIIDFKTRVPGKPWVGGNHWHNDHERFRILRGIMPTTVLENIATGEREIWKDLGPGTVIDIPRFVAHAFEPAEHVLLLGILDGPFDGNDLNEYPLMDKFTCELLPSVF